MPDHGTVPVGRPTTDGLPTWAADELDETNGSQGPAVGLVDGELVGGLPHDWSVCRGGDCSPPV